MAYIVKQYLLPEDKTTEYLILAIALFLIIIVWAGILYKSTYFGEGQTKAFVSCDPGECPTNKFTGEKRCSKNMASPLQYDPIFEVCNPINGCSAFETPYALQQDGSANTNGACGDKNDGCSCVNFLATPSYIEVIFNETSGLANNIPGVQNTILLNQSANPYVGQGNNVPMTYKDPSSQFWEIGYQSLPFITPNVCFDIYADNTVVPINKVLECINRNPCINGKLAYVPKNSTAFINFNAQYYSGDSNLETTSLACVPDTVENAPDIINYPNTCKVDITSSEYYYVPVFNSSIGRITCFETDVINLQT